MYVGNYEYVIDSTEEALVAGGFFIGVYALAIAICVFLFVCWVKIFNKFGVKGWYALCPGLSDYMIYKHIWDDGWVFLLNWIPFYNIYLLCKTKIGLAKSFGKSAWFGVGLIFLSIIFTPILAFGSATYVGNPYTK